MPPDKYQALWISHSSLNDYLRCPRAYYFRYVYRETQTGRRINLITPALATGQAVHDVLESLSKLKTTERFTRSLHDRLDEAWKKVSGKRGGFSNPETEHQFRRRASDMLERVYLHPGPLAKTAVKVKAEKDLPRFWLSEEDNIILCGKIDWLEYLPDTDSVHIIDFKTGRRRAEANSLQLPIYYLLVTNCQKRPVEKASYWYLETDDQLSSQELPDMYQARNRILELACRVKLARQLHQYKCPHAGCPACEPFERLARGEGESVGLDQFGINLYILPEIDEAEDDDSVLL